MNNLSGFYHYIGKVALWYFVITAATFIIKDDVSLVDVVTIGKIFSLFMLLIVNGEIATDIDKRQKDIRIINCGILIVVIVITIITAMKFCGLDLEKSSISWFAKIILKFIYYNIFWISAFPLIAYAILDGYIAYMRNGTKKEKEVAVKFIVFVDLVCIFPLVLVYILTAIYSKIVTSQVVGLEVFTSGSMAIVLMSSAIATKAVESYFSSSES